MSASHGAAIFLGSAQIADIRRVFAAGSRLDLGSFRHSRLRVEVEVEWLRGTAYFFDPRPDTLAVSGISDLSGGAGVSWLLRAESSRVVPALSAGVGIHALSSAFRIFEIDQLFNSNKFGAYGGIGLRIALGKSGRLGLATDLRGVAVHDISRVTWRVGLARAFRLAPTPASYESGPTRRPPERPRTPRG